MSQDVNVNKELFWREVSKVNKDKGESCNKVKDRNGGLALLEVEVRRIWKKYFKHLYNVDTREEVGVHIYGYDGVRR